MDTLKDFFSDLKDRISNPLISSFVISWCFFNYRIPVALIFYKQNEIHWDKYKSFIDLIDSRQNNWRMIIFPALVAIAYTFLFPFIKSGVKIFNSWLTSATDSNIIERTKQHSVPVELHMALLESLTETKHRFETVIKSQSAMLLKNADLETKNQEILNATNSALLEYKEAFVKRQEENERLHLKHSGDEAESFDAQMHILNSMVDEKTTLLVQAEGEQRTLQRDYEHMMDQNVSLEMQLTEKTNELRKVSAAIDALAEQNKDLRSQIQEQANRDLGNDRPG